MGDEKESEQMPDEMMPKEQFDFIEVLRDYMYENSNMSGDEAYDFAFRVWQFKRYLMTYLDVKYGRRTTLNPKIIAVMEKERRKTMNSVQLIGRLTKAPEVRYTSGSQMAVATFNLAIDRPSKKGGEKETDFPRCTAFGKTAETIEKYLTKGDQVGIEGRLQTGSYEDRNGNTVYTTDVIVNRITFCQKGREEKQERPPQQKALNDFEALDGEVPF